MIWVLFFLLNYEQFRIYFFLPLRLLRFSSLIISLIFLPSTKIQHCENWNVIGLFPSYKLEKIELIQFFESYIIQKFVHKVCMNSLFYTVKLVESYKLYHANRLMEDQLKPSQYDYRNKCIKNFCKAYIMRL